MSSIDKLKEELEKMLSSQEDKQKLSLVNSPQDAMKFISGLGASLANKLKVEMQTRSADEPSDAIRELIALRREVVHFLKDEEQQKLTNERWGNILKEQLGLTLKYNESTQKEAKKNDANDDVVPRLIDRLKEEIRMLEMLQTTRMAPAPSSDGKQLPMPALKPDSGLMAQVKELLKNSPLQMLGKALDQKPEVSGLNKLKQAANAVDTYKPPTPFSMDPRPKPTPEK